MKKGVSIFLKVYYTSDADSEVEVLSSPLYRKR